MTPNSNKKIILVPVDFSEASEIAIECAIELAKVFKSEIILLNIFENMPVDEASRKQMQSQFIYRDIMKRLEKDAERITKNENINTGFLIKEGNIFEHIGKAAKEVSANLMVMGTHGIKGVQHITGSYAAKVMMNTPVPVIVVQKKSKYHTIKDILVYIDLSKDSKALENWACHYATVFGANIHIVISEEMRKMVQMKAEYTLAQIETLFKEKGVNYDIVSFSSEHNDFLKHLFQHAVKNNSELVMIEQKKDIDQYIIGKEEQAIIANPNQIPVFCVNPLINSDII